MAAYVAVTIREDDGRGAGGELSEPVVHPVPELDIGGVRGESLTVHFTVQYAVRLIWSVGALAAYDARTSLQCVVTWVGDGDYGT